MIEKIMKAVKSGNKKRGRNITLGAVVGMLLSCTTVMGVDEGLEIGNTDTDTEITFKKNYVAFIQGSEEDPYPENIWDGKTYTNNSVISGEYYGLSTSFYDKEINILNNGIIKGTESNGMKIDYIFTKDCNLNSVINNGVATGKDNGMAINLRPKANSYPSSGGMANVNMRRIINNGLASSSGSTYNGCGMYTLLGANSSFDLNSEIEVEDITNNGLITSYQTNNYSYGMQTMLDSSDSTYQLKINIENITNNGLIAAKTTGSSYSRGMSIEFWQYSEGEINDITNNGLIKSDSSDSSIGMDFFTSDSSKSSSITNITNNGLINSNADSSTNSTRSRGMSFYFSNSFYSNIIFTVENIINKGLINSNATGNGTENGHGISLDTYQDHTPNNLTVNNLTNTGVIYGKTNAIIKDDKSIVKGANNYGLLISGDTANGKVVDGVTIDSSSGTNQIRNYGLAFTTDGTNYYNYGNSNANHNFGNIPTSTVDIGGIDYTIRNVAVADVASSGAITGIKSFKIEDGALYSDNSLINDGKATKTNVILNGIENTLKVVGNNHGGGNILANAVINAYGTAVEFDGTSDGRLSLISATVNGGLKENTSAISGSSKADTLELINTVVNGNIDMKGGKNYIEAGRSTTVNGNITTEDGDDTFIAGDNVVINGDIALGDGKNSVKLGDKVYVNGEITIGNTANGVDFKGGSEVYLNGEVTFTVNEDTFVLGKNSVINKDIAMGDKDDVLTIGAGSIVNGKLDGGTGDNDILTFGEAGVASTASITKDNTKDYISISHDIKGFENINVGAKVIFASDLTISDATGIKIGTDGTLTLNVDSNFIDSIGGEEKIKGHALYNHSGTTITSEGGKLLLALNKLGNENTVSFGDTILGDGVNNTTIGTTSKLHIAKITGTNEVTIKAKPNLPDYLEYLQLNKIYHSIISVEDLIDNFKVDDDEKISTFLSYLNDIYAGSPYSYSSELSRKSTGMFRDIVTDNQFKANIGKWMIYGGLTHVDGGTKDTYYGKGYYTYDIGSSDMDADTKITGAYMLGEYGVSDTLTSGVIIGGNKLKSDLSNGAKVDGSALYLGAYAKKYVGNLKVTAGAGFQYGDYDADRIAVNRVVSTDASPVMKYSDNYNDITYDIYMNGRYSHEVGDNLFLEPYATLSYTYVDQDGANEGNKTLAIETDSKSFDYTVGKIGIDLKKVIPHEKGKSTLSAGVSYTKMLDGADEEYITGRFKGGSDFDILVAHKNEHSIGLNAKYALELENGVLFDVKGTYSVERDSHNQSGKNKTKGEWIVGAGVGYKF